MIRDRLLIRGRRLIRDRRVIRDRRGFVLVAVLWLLVALAAVGLDAGLRGRSERLAAANALDDTRARAAANAGAEYARSRLTAAMLDQADELRSQAAAQNQRRGGNSRVQSVRRLFQSADAMDDPWRAPEELFASEVVVGDAMFRLQVRDTGAALNVNEATGEMLLQFFSLGLRVDFAVADQVTQAILDWIDLDDLPRIGGGEREQYLSDGLPVLPANGPFASLDELRYVRGMTVDAFEKAVPHLTLLGSGTINVNAAPVEVLLAIPGMTPAVATQLVRNRESGNFPRTWDEVMELLSLRPGSRAALEDRWEDVTGLFTTEVEIISEGSVVGSPVLSTLHLVVTRAEEGAVVVWRRVE